MPTPAPSPLPTTPSAAPTASAVPRPTDLPPGHLPLRLWLTFDALPFGELTQGRLVVDASGSGNDGHVELPGAGSPKPESIARSVGGRAVRFPQPCGSGPSCRRGIVVVPDADRLDPGTAEFSFGADVRIDLADLRAGSNVVQKGFARGVGGQWKLQVDDARGFPSCVLGDSRTHTQLRVLGDVSVADGRWHEVLCRRRGTEVSLRVDDAVIARGRTSAVLDIANTEPISIGGKHTKPDGDFLFGDVDDVFVRVAD